MLMQLSAVGEQLGSAQEAPVRPQELQAPNRKLLPSEHELHETAASEGGGVDITRSAVVGSSQRSEGSSFD